MVKVLEVIYSCKTLEQLTVAYKYMDNYFRLNPERCKDYDLVFLVYIRKYNQIKEIPMEEENASNTELTHNVLEFRV